MNSYDVIIIGAGSIGAPLAMFLAGEKAKVLVLDAAASPGQGQNKAAIGGVRATHSDGSKIKAGLRSLEIFSTWKENHGDDISWRKGGYCFPCYTEKDEKMMKEMLAVQKKFGLKINWLDGKQTAELVEGINAEGLRGCTYSPDDGSASPLLSVNAFYRRAKKLGAAFNFNEKVEKIFMQKNKVYGVQTNKNRYGAGFVVNAAGAGAKAVAALAGIKIPVNPDTHEAGITEPVERFLEPMVVDIRECPASKNYYFYQNAEGQIVFSLTPNPPVWGEDRRSTSGLLPEIAKRIIRLIAKLSNIRVRRTWRGLYPMTPDGFPIVDFACEPEGFVLAAGMCGQGFMLGPGIGDALSKAILNKAADSEKTILKGFALNRDFSGQEKLK
ncbi:MAG: FAD-binding oxidoreductase [Elusimicrobia bacterium]|nr:FAD-binding oxidoreductase [Elusimicrobiota bacterium]